MNRARRLERMGALRVLDPRELTAMRLAEEARKLLTFIPADAEINLEGATRTPAILEQLLHQKNFPAAAVVQTRA
jgi:predicted glycosyltransferase